MNFRTTLVFAGIGLALGPASAPAQQPPPQAGRASLLDPALDKLVAEALDKIPNAAAARLLYANTKSLPKTLLVLLAVPFSAVGAVWLLYALGYHISIGVWVGLIALLGLDAETGIFMLLYLDIAYEERKAAGQMRSRADLEEAILHGAVKRVRPKIMTVACAFFGLVPIMWSTGAGADVMKRIAAPMIGGLFTSFLMELLVYPAIYLLWKWREVRRAAEAPNPTLAAAALEG